MPNDIRAAVNCLPRCILNRFLPRAEIARAITHRARGQDTARPNRVYSGSSVLISMAHCALWRRDLWACAGGKSSVMAGAIRRNDSRYCRVFRSVCRAGR